MGALGSVALAARAAVGHIKFTANLGYDVFANGGDKHNYHVHFNKNMVIQVQGLMLEQLDYELSCNDGIGYSDANGMSNRALS